MVKIYDSIWNKHRLRKVATGVGWVFAVIGVAGIPEDMRMWAMWLETIGSVLDLWVVRVGLTSVGLALVTYPQWLPRARKVLSRPNSADKPEVNWQEAEDRFGFIDGELDTIWTEYDDGSVEWRIKPVGSDTDGRREKRFIIEARRLGRKLKGRDVPRLFPNAVLDDPAHEWLNVVGANVAPSSIAGNGIFYSRHFTWGCLDKVIDASKLTCRHFAADKD